MLTTRLINECGHKYDTYTHLFLNEKDEIICCASDAKDIFESLKEQDQEAILDLVSRAYKVGFEEGQKIYKKKIKKLFDLEE